MTGKCLIRLLAVVIAAAALMGGDCGRGAPRSGRGVKRYGLPEFFKIRYLRGASFSSDGSRIIFISNETGIFNAYSFDLRTSSQTPVTRSTGNAIFHAGWFPEDGRAYYEMDSGGDENTRLFVIGEDGDTTSLTGGADTKESFLCFTLDGRFMFTMTNQRDHAAFDVYRRRTSDLKPEMVFRNEDADPYMIGPISGDGRLLAMTKTVGNESNRLFIRDLASGRQQELFVDKSGARFLPQDFTPDGKILYYTTDLDSEFLRLMRLDLESGETTRVEAAQWDVMSARLSDKGDWLTVRINRDGRTMTTVTNLKSGKRLTFPKVDDAAVVSAMMDHDEQKLALYVESDVSPPSLYLYEIASGMMRELESADNPAVDRADLVRSELVRFRARDGLSIPGYLYRPKGASPGDQVPAVIWVHGGPGAQTRYEYSASFQLLANRGYAVFAINNRGSGGYGRTFSHADDRRHGKEPLWDCVDAKRFLAGKDWIDGKRIAIAGQSYGGYMTLAALAFEPYEFAAGVDFFGVSNWVRTLESMPPYWRTIRGYLYAEIGDPATDRDALIEISPLFHADRIVKPLMVVQGANDVRVLKSESDDIVRAVRARGVKVDYLVFSDEGHGFAKTDNAIRAWGEVLSFLDANLKGIEPAASVDYDDRARPPARRPWMEQ